MERTNLTKNFLYLYLITTKTKTKWDYSHLSKTFFQK